METIGKVRHAFLVKGKTIKGIARELNLARNTVRGIVRAEETERHYVRADQPLPQLGGFAAALDEMLSANAGKARRDRLTFQRMFEELRVAGYGGGYDAVRRYGRAWEKRHCERQAEAYVPLSFAPGEAYQFDWSHEYVVIDGVTTMAIRRACRVLESDPKMYRYKSRRGDQAALKERIKGIAETRAGEAFAEAVDTIARFLVPFECWSMINYGLYGDEGEAKKVAVINDEAKARALLKLLDLTVGTSEGAVIPHDLTDALDQIRSVAPALVDFPVFRRLSTAARR